MLLDDFVFLGGQRPRLHQDVIADADLADVVEERAEPQHFELRLVQRHGAADGQRQRADAFRMAGRVRIARVERQRERANRADVRAQPLGFRSLHRLDHRIERHRQRIDFEAVAARLSAARRTRATRSSRTATRTASGSGARSCATARRWRAPRAQTRRARSSPSCAARPGSPGLPTRRSSRARTPARLPRRGDSCTAYSESAERHDLLARIRANHLGLERHPCGRVEATTRSCDRISVWAWDNLAMSSA